MGWKKKKPHICKRRQTHGHQCMTSHLNGLNGWKVPEKSSHIHNSDLMSSCSWITRNHRMLCEKSLFCLKPLILQGQKLRSQQKPHGAQEQILGFLVQIAYQGVGSSGVGFTPAHSTSEPPLPLSPLFCEFRPATWPQGVSLHVCRMESSFDSKGGFGERLVSHEPKSLFLCILTSGVQR